MSTLNNIVQFKGIACEFGDWNSQIFGSLNELYFLKFFSKLNFGSNWTWDHVFKSKYMLFIGFKALSELRMRKKKSYSSKFLA